MTSFLLHNTKWEIWKIEHISVIYIQWHLTCFQGIFTFIQNGVSGTSGVLQYVRLSNKQLFFQPALKIYFEWTHTERKIVSKWLHNISYQFHKLHNNISLFFTQSSCQMGNMFCRQILWLYIFFDASVWNIAICTFFKTIYLEIHEEE